MIQLDMEMPNNCLECPFCGYPKPTPGLYRYYKVCLVDDKNITTTRRPKHCILHEGAVIHTELPDPKGGQK